MPVTRGQIVATALDLLDEAGLDGLTLRQLAARLGVRAPTLYWHVRDKRELLDLLAAAILEEALAAWREPQPGQPWWEWLAARARVMRAALLAHRDSARIVAGNRPPESSLPGIERQLRALAGAGFSPRDGLLALLALNAYVIGDVIDQQADETRQRPAPTKPMPSAGPPAPAEPVASAGPAGGGETPPEMGPDGPYPLLSAAMGGTSSPDLRFEHGLGALIAGFRTRHAG
ncbi:MAG TPA: TetR/AcrR family transcriptional regulator C-terminal domain-containing protein [Streptosporangiaceae bacterium]|jgi:TetR/AcrR family tetracycline transcriptional repressor